MKYTKTNPPKKTKSTQVNPKKNPKIWNLPQTNPKPTVNKPKLTAPKKEQPEVTPKQTFETYAR